MRITQLDLKYKTFLRFSAVGIVGLLVEISCLICFYEFFAFSALAGKAVAFPVAVLVTWGLNRNLTFRIRRNDDLLKEFFRYLNVTLIGALVNNSVYILVVTLFGSGLLVIILAVVAGSVSGLATNFLGSKRYVFTKESTKE